MKKLTWLMSIIVVGMALVGCIPLTDDFEGNEAPVVSGPNSVTVEVDSAVPDWSSYITVTDSDDPKVIITDGMIDSSLVDLSTVGSYVVTYNVEDSEGLITVFTLNVEVTEKEEVEVIVNTPPVISGTESITLTLYADEPDWRSYVTASDVEDGNIAIIDSMIDSSLVNFGLAASYEVTYLVEDSEGLTANFTLTVIVEEPVVKGFDSVEAVYTAYADLGGRTVSSTKDGRFLAEEIFGKTLEDLSVDVSVDNITAVLVFLDNEEVRLYLVEEKDGEFKLLANYNMYKDLDVALETFTGMELLSVGIEITTDLEVVGNEYLLSESYTTIDSVLSEVDANRENLHIYETTWSSLGGWSDACIVLSFEDFYIPIKWL